MLAINPAAVAVVVAAVAVVVAAVVVVAVAVVVAAVAVVVVAAVVVVVVAVVLGVVVVVVVSHAFPPSSFFLHLAQGRWFFVATPCWRVSRPRRDARLTGFPSR